MELGLIEDLRVVDDVDPRVTPAEINEKVSKGLRVKHFIVGKIAIEQEEFNLRIHITTGET